MDVLTLGGASQQRKMARAQQAQAEAYAASQEQMADAIAASSKASPAAVQASTADVSEAAASNVYSAQKRKKTVASTQNPMSGSTLGGSSKR